MSTAIQKHAHSAMPALAMSEEELIGVVQLPSKPLIDDVDQSGKCDALLAHHPRPDFMRPVQRFGISVAQADRPLADLLEAV